LGASLGDKNELQSAWYKSRGEFCYVFLGAATPRMQNVQNDGPFAQSPKGSGRREAKR
jgi:hypothetical protein